MDRCDLSEGIVTDDANRTVTFHLTAPDPDFLAKLALPFGFPVPENVPMDAPVEGAFPGTGPYTVVEVTETEVRLARNPHFEIFDGEVRPDGFPDEIVFMVVRGTELPTEEVDVLRVGMVEAGEADFTSYRRSSRTSPDLFARVRDQYPGQWHVGSIQTLFVNFNSSLPPFDNIDARRAVNLAIDRGVLSDLSGGPPDAAITCQLLPPGWPGYQPYCPHTMDPDKGGRWSAPDAVTAQRLVDASGTRGAEVVVGPTFPVLQDHLAHVGSTLESLGYR